MGWFWLVQDHQVTAITAVETVVQYLQTSERSERSERSFITPKEDSLRTCKRRLIWKKVSSILWKISSLKQDRSDPLRSVLHYSQLLACYPPLSPSRWHALCFKNWQEKTTQVVIEQDPSSRACQAQIMAAIPTFNGNGGPILSLTGEQCTE